MKIEKFEDLIAWQEARKLVNLIYDIIDKKKIRDFSLAGQIQRAAVSVMANISEGFSRYTFKDSKQFFITARSSLSETRSHLYLFLDRSMVSEQEFKDVFEQITKVNKLVNGLIRNIKLQISSALTNEQMSQ